MDTDGPDQQACWQLTDEQLAGAMVAAESSLRRDYADMLELIAEAKSRELSSALGYRDLRAMLSDMLRISPHTARARVDHAEATLPTTSVVGANVPPPMPTTGSAVSAGEINAEHVHELHKVMQQVSGRVDAAQYFQVEHDLMELARQSVPAAVRTAGRHLLRYLDQDGKRPRENDPDEATPHRRFRSHYKRNGWLAFDGELDPETASLLDGLFGTLARPEPADASGQPDPRGTMQRQGDALAEIIDLAARTDELPTQGGERATLTLTVPLHVLEERARHALLDLPHGLSPAALRRLACDAKVVPAVLGSRGEVLDVGRASRHATAAQRHALVLRDHGCAYPGCSRGPKWTTPHHIVHWANGGATDVETWFCCARGTTVRSTTPNGGCESATDSPNSSHPVGSPRHDNHCATGPTTRPDNRANHGGAPPHRAQVRARSLSRAAPRSSG